VQGPEYKQLQEAVFAVNPFMTKLTLFSPKSKCGHKRFPKIVSK
jgi:hypothetical protein